LTWAKLNLSPNEKVEGICLAHGYHFSNGLTVHGLTHPCSSVAVTLADNPRTLYEGITIEKKILSVLNGSSSNGLN